MNIHEYQAKQLFERFGVATPKGIAAATAQEAAQTARNMGLSQYVVKAQVHAGGRGKGTFKNGFKGGVHVVKSVEEVEEVAGKMLNQVLVTKQTGETGKLVSKIKGMLLRHSSGPRPGMPRYRGQYGRRHGH